MADRLLLVYKTPLQRIIETSLVLAGSLGLAALWQTFVPGISSSYITVASLFLGFAVVPRLGSAWAVRHGNDMVTREERNRRYLGEIGPLGTVTPAFTTARRRMRR
jgi:hypothetical protein